MRSVSRIRAAQLAVAASVLALAPLASRPAGAVDIGTLRIGLSRLANMSSPTSIAAPKDGSGRLFVTQKSGAIRVRFASGTVQGTPYLTVPGVLSGGERGLLGLAFHPSFSSNGYFYVAYTDGDGALQVSRFRASPPSANTVSAATQTKIINVPHPGQANHNGGQLAFGPDGYLYVGTGDGGGGGDPDNNAHDTTTLLGKILRINVNCGGGAVYCIPPSNPYASSSTSRKEIWDYGLRNPWRFSFDRSGGALWVADVGQNDIEEVNRVGAGQGNRNFGWDCWEGTAKYSNASYCTALSSTTRPIAQYDHSGGDCAVIGGFVYRGSRYAANMAGIYIFGDYCTGIIRGLQSTGSGWRMRQLMNHGGLITSFGEDADGELYAADEGGLFRVTASGGVTATPPKPAPRQISASPSPKATASSPKPSPSPSASASPSPTNTGSPLAQGSDGGGGASPWWILAGVGGAAAIGGAGWLVLGRRRVT